jgi:hypothetical protein
LASGLGVDRHFLFRFLRALESIGLLEFGPEGFVLSESGKLLALEESSISSIPALIAEQYLPAWSNLAGTLRNGTPAFEQAFGVSVWKHRQQNPHLNEAFGRMIKEPATNEIKAILDAYDFGGFGKVVDIGGGSGWLLAGILAKYTDVSGLLFDQPHVVKGFLDTIDTTGIRDRCAVIGGSFFDSVPAEGALYLMQSILHDWGDDDCVRILERTRASMTSDARLLVLERIIPADAVMPTPLAMLDMHMMAVLGGRERTLVEFDALFARAGLRRLRVIATAGFAADIIEAERL